jgi:hypothetical protein
MKMFAVALLLVYTKAVIAVLHQQHHQFNYDHQSPDSHIDINDWADSLIVDEADVVDNHQQHLSLPMNSPPLHHHLSGDQVVGTTKSHDKAQRPSSSSGYNADHMKWIESVLMNDDDDEPEHTTEHTPISRTPPNIFSPSGSSGLSSAGLSVNVNRGTKDKTPSGPYSPKPYKQRWTLDYKKSEVKRVHDAVDAMVLQRFGPTDPERAFKRRYNFLSRLSKEQIDDLSKGKSIYVPSRGNKSQRGARKSNRRHWTKGFNRSDMATINKFIEEEVIPSRRGGSASTKNNIIRQLTKGELKAIIEGSQIEKKKIVEKFVKWKEVSVKSKGERSIKRQNAKEA